MVTGNSFLARGARTSKFRRITDFICRQMYGDRGDQREAHDFIALRPRQAESEEVVDYRMARPSSRRPKLDVMTPGLRPAARPFVQ